MMKKVIYGKYTDFMSRRTRAIGLSSMRSDVTYEENVTYGGVLSGYYSAASAGAA